jgi:subfamily B ATP-binding cassette protein HlyB/CyaB
LNSNNGTTPIRVNAAPAAGHGAEGSSAAGYRHVIQQAVAGLSENNGKARQRIYERARAALTAQLQTRKPPLDDGEIAVEMKGLEQAVSEVEAGLRAEAPDAPRFGAQPANDERGPEPSPFQGIFSWPNVADEAAHDEIADGDNLARSAGSSGSEAPIHPRLAAMIQAGRYQGLELDVGEFRQESSESIPSAAALSLWAQNAGMWSRAVRTTWRQLIRLNDSGPVVLLFTDGSAGLMTGANAAKNFIALKDPLSPAGTPSVMVDELRLSQVWAGEVVLLRAARGTTPADAVFNFRWLAQLVLHEKGALRDIGIASLTISFLTVFPPILVMATVNKVLQFHSVSTLVLISAVMAVVVAYETLLGYARRQITAVVAARLDAKLNLHLFSRLLRLPLDFFERHPAGETMYKIAQIYQIRDFLTGKLLATFLDLITLCVLLPFLFYLNATLAWIVVGCASVVIAIILSFLKPLRDSFARVIAAETWKAATLSETIIGIKTVKALALEPQRRAAWDERIAEAGKARLEFSQLSN